MQVFFGHSVNPGNLRHRTFKSDPAGYCIPSFGNLPNPANISFRSFKSDPAGFSVPSFGFSLKKTLKKAGKVVKKTVSAPSNIAAKVVTKVAKPVLGKKITGALTTGLKVATNPIAAASLTATAGRKTAQTVVGKKAYRVASTGATNLIKNNAGNIAATAANLFVPGAGTAALQAGRGLKKTTSAFRSTGNSAIDNILKTVQKNIPVINPASGGQQGSAQGSAESPAPQAEAVASSSKLPLYIGGGLLAFLLLKGKR